ncbi:unnamed protein product [Prunus armeniaca]|uniref:Uncharacterized protein n=1 Tax=Prunus armeniaca TaxID=36596 RepID=A0A6J5XAE9_PRUAR|nr:unnamed protein product [Prunus armeniaca]
MRRGRLRLLHACRWCLVSFQRHSVANAQGSAILNAYALSSPPKVAATIHDINRAVRLIEGCGRRVPRHFKCGSITTP